MGSSTHEYSGAIDSCSRLTQSLKIRPRQESWKDLVCTHDGTGSHVMERLLTVRSASEPCSSQMWINEQHRLPSQQPIPVEFWPCHPGSIIVDAVQASLMKPSSTSACSTRGHCSAFFLHENAGCKASTCGESACADSSQRSYKAVVPLFHEILRQLVPFCDMPSAGRLCLSHKSSARQRLLISSIFVQHVKIFSEHILKAP